jgi:hypothetical protein
VQCQLRAALGAQRPRSLIMSGFLTETNDLASKKPLMMSGFPPRPPQIGFVLHFSIIGVYPR